MYNRGMTSNNAGHKQTNDMTMYHYHCSPIKNLNPEITVARSLCLADDRDIAAAYLRGEDGHCLYEASWDSADIASESELHEICKSIGVKIGEGLEYEATKKQAVRQAIVDAGFDGVRYGDTHDGCNYWCVEFFATPIGFAFASVEEF
jgi:hypothetical protein